MLSTKDLVFKKWLVKKLVSQYVGLYIRVANNRLGFIFLFFFILFFYSFFFILDRDEKDKR